LWILSRQKTLTRGVLDPILARASDRGFPVGILGYTEQ
jgi:lipocalin